MKKISFILLTSISFLAAKSQSKESKDLPAQPQVQSSKTYTPVNPHIHSSVDVQANEGQTKDTHIIQVVDKGSSSVSESKQTEFKSNLPQKASIKPQHESSSVDESTPSRMATSNSK